MPAPEHEGEGRMEGGSEGTRGVGGMDGQGQEGERSLGVCSPFAGSKRCAEVVC